MKTLRKIGKKILNSYIESIEMQYKHIIYK